LAKLLQAVVDVLAGTLQLELLECKVSSCTCLLDAYLRLSTTGCMVATSTEGSLHWHLLHIAADQAIHCIASQVNYGIAAPLLSDIASALTAAASSHADGKQPLQRVRLHFAHCETLTPLASLLGLFKPGPEEQRGMPEVPSGRALKSAVKISTEQVGAHGLGHVVSYQLHLLWVRSHSE
jgi:multiple inositol-polyphosphate phosphatase/2,3-bisphosphoglycerate 3-phosphatase